MSENDGHMTIEEHQKGWEDELKWEGESRPVFIVYMVYDGGTDRTYYASEDIARDVYTKALTERDRPFGDNWLHPNPPYIDRVTVRDKGLGTITALLNGFGFIRSHERIAGPKPYPSPIIKILESEGESNG